MPTIAEEQLKPHEPTNIDFAKYMIVHIVSHYVDYGTSTATRCNSLEDGDNGQYINH
jgi:hypothetical protein